MEPSTLGDRRTYVPREPEASPLVLLLLDVDRVQSHVPYRQWVLTQSVELARVVAFDAELAMAVFGVFADERARWQRERAIDLGLANPQTGGLLEIQRFADGAADSWRLASTPLRDGAKSHGGSSHLSILTARLHDLVGAL